MPCVWVCVQVQCPWRPEGFRELELQLVVIV